MTSLFLRNIRSKINATFIVLFVLLPIRPASADLVIVGEAVAVISGDTMKVLWTGGIEMVRLADVDCPKKGHLHWQEAKMFTEDQTIARSVIVTVKDVDKFGRSVGEVFLDDGKSLNKALVKNGLAKWTQKYLDGTVFSKLEREARGKKIGVWQE